MGSVVFSVDAELGWGFLDYADPPAKRINAGRAGWRALLDVFDTHDLTATWAVVGHLFAEDCDGVHADHRSVPGWFDCERGAWQDRPDLRFGPDLIDAVREAGADHELACHSYSHVRFDGPEVTKAIARSELSAAIEAAGATDVEFESFVFPRNGVGHRDVLADFGFRSYRGARSVPRSRLRRTAGKLRATAGAGGVGLSTPTVDEYGLVDVAPSLYLFGFEGWPRRLLTTIWDDPIVRIAKRGIDRACHDDGIFHVWLHPNNLATDADLRRVQRIAAYVADRRDGTDLAVETMADVAARTLDTARVAPATAQD